MKIYIKTIIAFSLILLISFSCTDKFEEMNTPKDLITEELVEVDMLFTRVLALAVIENEESGLGTIGNWAGISSSSANRPFAEGEDPTIWNQVYGEYVRNLNAIIQVASKKDNAEEFVNKIAVARILKAMFFAKLTDTYGDVPYFEAALPVEEAVTTPEYDAQKDIYADLFKELKEAVAQIDESKPKFTNADILYNGDLAKWKKFANSLRLRLALHIRYADEAMAKEQLVGLSEADLIIANEENASIYNIDDYPSHENSRYVDLVARKNAVVKSPVQAAFLDILKDNNDPRLKVFVDTAIAAYPQTPGYMHIDYFGYRGRPLLSGANPEEDYAYGNNSVSQWSSLLWVQIQEQPLYKASETYFNLSEAALFSLIAGDAQAYYKKGMELALEHAKQQYEKAVPQLPEVIALFNSGKEEAEINALVASYIAQKEITQAEINTFLSTPAATLSGSNENKLEQIINQKIIALFPMEHEGWVEHRRTGYPRLLVGEDNSSLNGRVPRRLPYPSSEQLLNQEEFRKAVERLGGAEADKRTTKFWWDANPDAYKPHPGTVETKSKPWIEDIID